MNNGAVSASAVSLKSITVAKSDGTVIAKVVSGDAVKDTTTCSAISSDNLIAATNSGILVITATSIASNQVTKELAPGSYVVTLEGTGGQTAKATFTVTDKNTTAASSLTVAEDVRTKTLAKIKGDADFEYTVVYDGVTYEGCTGSSITSIKGSEVTSGGVSVTAATGWVEVPGTGLYVDVTLPLSLYFPNAKALESN
jgi:hypothetical protein